MATNHLEIIDLDSLSTLLIMLIVDSYSLLAIVLTGLSIQHLFDIDQTIGYNIWSCNIYLPTLHLIHEWSVKENNLLGEDPVTP